MESNLTETDQGLAIRYVWSRWSNGRSRSADGAARGKLTYSTDHKTIRNSSLGKAALEVARDAIRRATGPYSREHPEAVKAWWEWQDGSTPFFSGCGLLNISPDSMVILDV